MQLSRTCSHGEMLDTCKQRQLSASGSLAGKVRNKRHERRKDARQGGNTMSPGLCVCAAWEE